MYQNKRLKIKKEDKVFTIKNTGKETLGKWYYLMSLGRQIDNKAPNYLKQALGWSYHAPYAGHDGIQLAIGQVFEKEQDHLFPYYRDMLTGVSAGLNAEEIILNGLSKKDDVASGGRHMSNHFAKPEWNIHNVSSCTGNHTLHAVGTGSGSGALRTFLCALEISFFAFLSISASSSSLNIPEYISRLLNLSSGS